MTALMELTDLTDRERLHEEYKQLRRATIGAAIEVGPVSLETLLPGEQRRLFSRDGFLDFLRNGTFSRLLDDFDITTQMADENQFAITLTPRREDAVAAGNEEIA